MDLAFLVDVKILKSDAFQIAVPLASAGLGVWMKSETRHSEKQPFTKQDFAIGIGLIQTACISSLTLATQKAIQLEEIVSKGAPKDPGADPLSKIMTASALFVGLLFFLFGMASMVRRIGWKDKDEMHLVRGIGIPFAAGVFCIYAVIRATQ